MGKPVNIQQCVITQLIVALEKNVIASSGISTALVGVKAAVTISQLLHKGCSQDFSKGGYTVSNRGYSLDCHVDLHAMFILANVTNKKTYKGRIQATQDPP